MAKKAAKKKTARRKASKKKAARRATSRRKSTAARTGSLRGVSTTALQAELQRRGSDLTKLEAKRDALMAELDQVDNEILVINAALSAAGLGGSSRRVGPGRARRAGARKRPRNEKSLEVALADVLKGKTMGVTEVAEAVQRAGYKTTSPNFRTIVNQTLIRSSLIKKLGRGAYTAK